MTELKENLLNLLTVMDTDNEVIQRVKEMEDEDMQKALLQLKSAIYAQSSVEDSEADVWYVYHHIHTQTPHKKLPKLFVTDVPPNEKVTWDLVDEYEQFGEFGSKHANHGIEPLTPDSPKEVKRAWRKKEPSAATAVSFEELVKLSQTV